MRQSKFNKIFKMCVGYRIFREISSPNDLVLFTQEFKDVIQHVILNSKSNEIESILMESIIIQIPNIEEKELYDICVLVNHYWNSK